MQIQGKQQLIIIGLGIAIIAGFGILRYYPLARTAKDVKQAQTLQLAAITQAESQSRQLPIIREQIKKIQAEVGEYDEKIPTSRDLAVFWQEIADIMNRFNLKDQLVQPGTETHDQDLACIPINIQCSGNIEQIFAFFNSLQKIKRVIRIEQLQLDNDQNLTGLLNAKAKANVYYRTSVQGSI